MLCLLTQMRPRRGRGANRRGCQSIDRVRGLITDGQGALDRDAEERIASGFDADGGGRLWARVVKWAWPGACMSVIALGLARLLVSRHGRSQHDILAAEWTMAMAPK